ncbi:hypothetical protein [Clostridium hydrogenum]|uniref:hypothetical protein n=1 Tax=Clostridium hydrogenum TaxID=2855764 RepID=UPI001F1B86ED|nr:hypothetical protein [Clostridium hydrogenum]
MINETAANLYLQLGIAGATLFILLVFVILLFKFSTRVSTSESSQQNNRIDKLCDKIDGLITSYSENTKQLNKVLLCNDKDQKETLSKLDTILEIAVENQRRISLIDDRTYKCPNK